jgi:modulator of FtsH protease
MIESWNSFFVAETAAAAALLGLLFVAISINLKQVLESAGLPDRALGALLMLLAMLLIGLLLLMPGQSLAVLGIETAAVTVVTGVIGALLGFRGLRLAAKEFRNNFSTGMPHMAAMRARIASRLWNVISFIGALAPILIGGVLMTSGGEAGFYWVGAGMCLSLIKAVSEGWIFLVEINR